MLDKDDLSWKSILESLNKKFWDIMSQERKLYESNSKRDRLLDEQ